MGYFDELLLKSAKEALAPFISELTAARAVVKAARTLYDINRDSVLGAALAAYDKAKMGLP